MRLVFAIAALMTPVLCGCQSPDAVSDSGRAGGTHLHETPELISLLERPLYARLPGTDRNRLSQAFLQSIVDAAVSPPKPENVIWPGRRLGYLWRMNDAVAFYTLALKQFPDDARLYRHRGHRYISLRRFDDAIQDLQKAAALLEGKPEEIEPDGMPNERNIPLTTTAFNVWYHLGLARYLTGDFEGALAAYRRTMKHLGDHDDNLVATTHWMFMTLRRLGREAEAAALLEPIGLEMEIIENRAYHRCVLMYKGVLESKVLQDGIGRGGVNAVTEGYALGNWHLCNGKTDRAAGIFERVVADNQWPAFGFIAAEVELARMR